MPRSLLGDIRSGNVAGMRRTAVICLCFLAAGVSSVLFAVKSAETERPSQANSDVRQFQQTIDAAPSNSVVTCDPNRLLTLHSSVFIRKPLTLVGLRARLPEKLGQTSLIIVESPGVAVTDFEFTGNGDSVAQSDRAPLLIIRAGNFRVERGTFLNSSKDGVMIESAGTNATDIVGGLVRDIIGRGVIRDTVSISGSSGTGQRIRNVLVDNVRCYDSRLRGAVEVSDGTDNITVRKVYAESAVYALDVQDHNEAGQINRNVVIEDVYAVRCRHALRTANSAKSHGQLTIRDITAEECIVPLQISHTTNVTVSNVRVLGHAQNQAAIQMSDCHGVFLRDVVLSGMTGHGPGVLFKDCSDVLVDGMNVRSGSANLKSAIVFRLTRPGAVSGLRIANVLAPETSEAGILLQAGGKEKGTLSRYVIVGNLATVQDEIGGQAAVITNNLVSARLTP